MTSQKANPRRATRRVMTAALLRAQRREAARWWREHMEPEFRQAYRDLYPPDPRRKP